MSKTIAGCSHSSHCLNPDLLLYRVVLIKIKHGKPRTLQVQGLVEQAIGVVQSRITKWKMENGSMEWSIALPNISLGIN